VLSTTLVGVATAFHVDASCRMGPMLRRAHVKPRISLVSHRNFHTRNLYALCMLVFFLAPGSNVVGRGGGFDESNFGDLLWPCLFLFCSQRVGGISMAAGIDMEGDGQYHVSFCLHFTAIFPVQRAARFYTAR